MQRKEFIAALAGGAAAASAPSLLGREKSADAKKPNLVFVFGDQWRAGACGYAGDPNVKTPHLDALARESVNFVNAVSGCPVCSPYRASLLTGQYPLTHGVFVNDVQLPAKATSVAEALAAAGYDTAYIGKWHIDGRGRSSFIPRERRQGFDFWKVLECTHNYNRSAYYADADERQTWDGYDAIAQTREAQRYIAQHARGEKPFALYLSWGPPHAPYQTAPEKYRAMYPPDKIKLPPNVPREFEAKARQDLAGYYAHCTALDDCVRDLLATLDEAKIADDTIFVFTSDHGDMLYSHGFRKKQQPWDESIRVPFLLRYPRAHGKQGRTVKLPLNTPDIMPTLLGLCGAPILQTVEGENYAGLVTGAQADRDAAALLSCPAPFGQWTRRIGGREYRGVRTQRYTYTRTFDGPWLLFDNEKDPWQLENLVDKPEHAAPQKELETLLAFLLKKTGDDFRSGWDYLKKWNYKTDKDGTVPYTN